MYTHKMSTVVLFSHFQAVCLHDKYVGSSCSDSRIEVCCYGIGLALWLITTALAASLSAQTRWLGPVPWYAEQFTVDQQDIPQLLLMAMDTIPWVIHCEMWDARKYKYNCGWAGETRRERAALLGYSFNNDTTCCLTNCSINIRSSSFNFFMN